jgi:hypothetical protein
MTTWLNTGTPGNYLTDDTDSIVLIADEAAPPPPSQQFRYVSFSMSILLALAISALVW